MAANDEPLQGSLFGEKKPILDASKSHQQQPEKKTENLSDEYLTNDAKRRPRQRQEAKNLRSRADAIQETHSNATIETDLPTWSNHALVNPEQVTPVLRHYVELKSKNPDRILLYRLGDFFECFFEDAIKLSELLELTLTGKEGGKAIGRVPMAGIPHHAAERYCSELIKRGLSVALCDQLESIPKKGSLIKRDITRVLTPGTVIEEGMLQAKKNNWLAALVIEPPTNKSSLKWALASADVSTGEFLLMERIGSQSLFQELNKMEASEIIWGESLTESTGRENWCPETIHITKINKGSFSQPEAELALKRYYKVETINGLGLQDWSLAMRAAGGLLTYLNDVNPISQETKLANNSIPILLDVPKLIFPQDYLIVDAQTRRNLEITTTQKDGQFQGSLLWAIDRTLTAMGGRCLRRWLDSPLMDISEIFARQEIISLLVEDRGLRQAIRRLLRTMGDLERLAGRAGAGQAGARDLVAIAEGIDKLPRLSERLLQYSKQGPTWLKALISIDPNLINLANKIRYKLIENPPLSLSEGGIIQDGVDPLLDGMRNQLDDQNDWLKSQERLEQKLSGNNNLRLQYHRTFGYFLSVSKAKANQVPEHWIRRQTLANEERFITPDLKAREGKIFQAKARAAQLEYEIFCKLREDVGKEAGDIRKAARAVAGLDALTGLAEVAATESYCAPQILKGQSDSESRKINIEGGRHPVVEQTLVEKKFIPNDIILGEKTDLIVLTGPNASGKSCYLRQTGVIQLLAQTGSWVPAKKASLSIADRIFTRVGAVDDLASGQSTFMVEMSETAFILNQATNRSLVLLDEIGRGTATYDGLSIAWSVSEFLAKEIQSRTIFATHYHELNALSDTFNNVKNYQVLVEETGENLSFLHVIVPGGSNKSYGIEAARLAGVPNYVVQRARQILASLQKQSPIPPMNSPATKNKELY